MFEIGGCEEVWSSIFWAQRRGKREHQMRGCVSLTRAELRSKVNRPTDTASKYYSVEGSVAT